MSFPTYDIALSVLFDLFDVDEQKFLTHDGLFRIYKLLFTNAISDDHILALTFSALRHPSLAKEGQVTREEFIRVGIFEQRCEKTGLRGFRRGLTQSDLTVTEAG